MGSSELAIWAAFAEEFGFPDGFFVAGQVCGLIGGALGSRQNSAADYVPYFRDGTARRMSGDQMLKNLVMCAGAQ